MNRPTPFWVLMAFTPASVVLLFLGQTLAVFNYEFTVNLEMQEDIGEVGAFGVQVNRAFGAGDTLV